MNRRRGCLIVLLVLAILAVAAWLILRQPTPRTAADVSPHVAQLTQDPDLSVKYEGRQDVSFGKVDTYSAQLGGGDRVTFEVDPETGAIRGFARYGQPGGSVNVDLAAAQAAVSAFAMAIGASQELLAGQPDQAELVDHGEGTAKYYSFSWVRTDPQSGAILPQELQARVNAQTGKVDSYSSVDVAVTVSTNPSVGRERAVELALTEARDLQAPAVSDATLFVSTVPVFEPNGEQALLWSVTIEGQADEPISSSVTVFIDAQTGEVLYVAPSM